MEINTRWDPNRCSSNSSTHPLSHCSPSKHAQTSGLNPTEVAHAPRQTGRCTATGEDGGGRSRVAAPPGSKHAPGPLHPPVVALFAELLLEVAQGETVAAHGPPVRDLLAAEEIRDHGLAGAGPVAPEALFALLPAGRSQRGREGRVRALVPNQEIRRYNGNARSELPFFSTPLGSV